MLTLKSHGYPGQQCTDLLVENRVKVHTRKQDNRREGRGVEGRLVSLLFWACMEEVSLVVASSQVLKSFSSCFLQVAFSQSNINVIVMLMKAFKVKGGVIFLTNGKLKQRDPEALAKKTHGEAGQTAVLRIRKT